ncbi:hypothetical protein TWF225_011503 [Orbilia oligospora]|nr:hypothetical protein TWF225_011503 [Orbilia oligospora]KAF3242867.1 hypothetical protein TWF217_011416 [Orbilia oligospora]KAF3294925.1 hypothetical protein TWF132_002838 [Orbilia oligospora]
MADIRYHTSSHTLCLVLKPLTPSGSAWDLYIKGWNSSNWIPPFVLDQPKSTDSICNHDKDSIFILRDATSVQRNEPIHQHKQLQDHVINLQFVQLHPAQGYQPV